MRESEKKDARLKRIIPTRKAEALRPSILAHIRQSEAQLTADISEADVLICKKVLCQMLYNVSEHKEVCKKMNKKLLQSVREYKSNPSLPLFGYIRGTDGSIDSSGNGKNY